jgi:oxysterol-binding protein-related protein 3/6/7
MRSAGPTISAPYLTNAELFRNLMMGTKYLEHIGDLAIENKTTGARCLLEFQEAGYWSPPNVIKGTVYSPSGRVTTTIEGKWDEQLAQKLDDAHLKVLWRIAPFPKNSRELYGFTSFGITLHEITPDLKDKLPPTDSRLRPDVTALERGDLDTAEREKVRIEEAQRERRRAGEDAKPRWFKKTGADDWEYIGGYWEQREKGWQGVEPLW